MKRNIFITGDCVEELKKIPDESIDMIFADPPYNLQIDNNLSRPNGTLFDGVNEEWDEFNDFKTYDTFTFNWLKESKRILKKDGSIFVMGMYHNVFRVGNILQNLGYWIINDIYWEKVNPTPNFGGTRLQNATETIIWAVKDKKSKFTFNYQLLKKLNNNKQMKNVWKFAVCSGKERLKDEFGNKLHSTQKPIDLIKRIVIMSTNCGDLILDPFMGTGTTAQAAIELNRNFVGIDYIEKYNRAAEERIKSVEIDKELLNLEKMVNEQIEKNKNRLSIVQIIEKGLLKAGDVLTFYYSPTKKSDIQVPLLNSGKVVYENSIFSIHQLGKIFLQTPSCNGYKYWYFTNDNGQDESIENLRR